MKDKVVNGVKKLFQYTLALFFVLMSLVAGTDGSWLSCLAFLFAAFVLIPQLQEDLKAKIPFLQKGYIIICAVIVLFCIGFFNFDLSSDPIAPNQNSADQNPLLVIALIASLVILALLVRSRIKLDKEAKRLLALNEEYRERFPEIFNADDELEKVKALKAEVDEEYNDVKAKYKVSKEIYDKLVAQIAIYDEDIELIELGFYKPHYDFDVSERYKEEIDKIRAKQKKMVSDNKAIYCSTQWTVEGSKAKGKTMMNRAIRLTARAFNNECDSAIASTTWKNANRMEARLEKAYEAINKLNESNAVIISEDYLLLKLEELRLTHEYKEKKQAEKEEQAELRRQIREEEQLQKEVEEADKEEQKFQKLLDKAKADAEKAAGDKLQKLQDKMKKLEEDLAAAHEKSERAKSMAQLTKSGHVYVISNVGAFGDDVYKIGMTRRLDPLDRVKELGDASVPFLFDVHAMIYSQNAPELENELHKVFAEKRVNLVNTRKEFFNVSLEDIEHQVIKIKPEAEFVRKIEAREYHETLSIRKQLMDKEQNGFPDDL